MFEKYSPQSPSRKVKMSLSFAFSAPSHIIATFFGAGVIRPASGTWGSLAALLVYAVFDRWIPAWGWLVIILTAFLAGAWACEATGRDIGVHDHSSIVIDEVFAVWMVLVTLPSAFSWQVAGFLTFRFFDIVKIQPAKWFDTAERWHNGWGVMLDDAAAAVQSAIVLAVFRMFV
jgi:phosphatidylglycerophosphatase A